MPDASCNRESQGPGAKIFLKRKGKKVTLVKVLNQHD